MPRHPPSTPPTSRLNAFDPLTLTDGRLDSFEGVVGERENRGLEKSLSGAVRRQEEGIRGVGGLGLEDFKQLCVSQPEVCSPYHILRDTLTMSL